MTSPDLVGAAQLIGAAVLVFNSYQTWNNGQRAKRIASEVTQVREQTDGINADLVKLTSKAQYAKGLKKGSKR